MIEGVKMVPAFIPGNFEARLAFGDKPGTGSEASHDMYVWARHVGCDDEGSVARVAGDVSMLAIADMTPPAITSKFSKPAPVASSTWLVNFMDTAPVAEEGGWWLLRSCEEFAVDGYQSQMMEVWGRHGRLVCNSRQLVAFYA